MGDISTICEITEEAKGLFEAHGMITYYRHPITDLLSESEVLCLK
jgi:hypothetical protein